jgi:hypothetical protein
MQIDIFELPEIKKLFKDLINELIDESDRGAILIGSSYVEQYLENMIVSIFPSTLSTNKRGASVLSVGSPNL